ncbi:MAG: 2-oxo acid dehydrogenase subunit E2 [Solirubrobacterales bacterium]|nr:2-oxo acid dehydrogenase subunit E2 [Solirubrobacterales bacterium]
MPASLSEVIDLAQEVNMPRLSDSMEEGVILAWLKSEGDEVALGDELVEIETDKANMVYESDFAGTLIEIVAEVEATAPVGALIARIGEAGEKPAERSENGSIREASPKSEGRSDSENRSSGEGGPSTVNGSSADGDPKESTFAATREADPEDSPAQDPSRPRVKASPLARRIAGELGVDLSTVTGSGPGGRVVKADVEAAPSGDSKPAEGAAAPMAGRKDEPESVALNRLQQTIARRMSESKATIPHFYLNTEIDMTRCIEARSGIKASMPDGGVVPSFNDMVIKACAIALREFPKANASYRDKAFEFHSRVNIGVAVAGDRALVVPVVTDADRKGLTDIATTVRELAAKVRDGRITPPELSGGTFSVSNLGMFGVSSFDAVINPGQAAILAVGAIEEKPVVRGGEIIPRSLMSVTLSCDHRILYGAEGAEFLARIKDLLEEPLALAL